MWRNSKIGRQQVWKEAIESAENEVEYVHINNLQGGHSDK